MLLQTIQRRRHFWVTCNFYNAKCSFFVGILHVALVKEENTRSNAFGSVKQYTMKGDSIFLSIIHFVESCIGENDPKSLTTFNGGRNVGPSSSNCEMHWLHRGVSIYHYLSILLWWLYWWCNNVSANVALYLSWDNVMFTSFLKATTSYWLEFESNTICQIGDSGGEFSIHYACFSWCHSRCTRLHPFNVLMDLTKDSKSNTSFADWKLLFWVLNKWLSYYFVFEADQNFERVVEAKNNANKDLHWTPWLAWKLYNPLVSNALSEESSLHTKEYLLE